MQLYLALFLVVLCLWENCIAICPDGSASHLPCNSRLPFVCPEGYRCFPLFPPAGTLGQCCLDISLSDYTCPHGKPLGYGSPFGLVRCDGKIPNSEKCPSPYHCKAVERTRTRIGICCLHH